MKRVLRGLVTMATIFAVGTVPAVASAASGRGELQRQLDGVVAANAVGALAEVRDGRELWRGTSGVAVLGTTRAVPADGRFRVGSITKTFVATVVLQLAAEGRLRLDDSVEKWLPGVVPNGQNITLRQLLNHTSGLYDYVKTLAFPPSPEFFAGRWRTWTASEQIQQALAHPPTSEVPGKAYSYSNTGYLLLGQVITKVTGRSYGREIERRIIRPLHLHGTSVPGTAVRIPGPHQHGYVPTERTATPPLIDYTELNPSLFGASGEMISTTSDLNRFFGALLGGRLLPKYWLDEMKTPGTAAKNYGLGLAWKDTTCGIRAYGNDGDALAYNAWSFSSVDGRHQVSVALTPNFRGDPDKGVDALVDKAICS